MNTKLLFLLMLSSSLVAQKSLNKKLPEDKQEVLVKNASIVYLKKRLKMDPKIKSITITKDVTKWKKDNGIKDLSKSYHIIKKFKDSDIWLISYANKDDNGKPKIGNGSEQAKLIVNKFTFKVVGVWLMPK